MELRDFIKLSSKKRQTIWSWIFVFIALGMIFTFVQPLKYSTKSKLLVIQNTREVDPYTVSKSNEYLGNLFSQVIYSSSFYDLALDSQYNIDRSYFTDKASRQQKIWAKTVKAKSLSNTGIIEMEVYHPDPYQAKQIALAINDVLINKNFNYQGMGDTVRVSVIAQPLVSSYPTNPNPVVNFLLAVIFGLAFSFLYIYFLPEEKYNFYLFGRPRVKRHQARKVLVTASQQEIPVKTEKAPAQRVIIKSEPEFLSGNFVEHGSKKVTEEVVLVGNMSNILPR
jgi:capsular polysaccharide biosynthesis protein